MAFFKLGKVADINKDSGRLFIINGMEIAVFNAGGKFYAIENACPHKGGSLSEGMLDAGVVTCPLHGWQFDLETGKHLYLPSSVRKFNIKAEGNDLMVEL